MPQRSPEEAAPPAPYTDAAPADAPLVSIVVLSYCFARYLRECVESALAQEGGYRLEVVVVDDASPDGTPDVLDALAADPRVQILRHAVNQGHAQTVEDGLRAARGRYVARVDGDDRLLPTFLAEMVPVLEAHPEVGLVHGDARLMDADSRISAMTAEGTDDCGDRLEALLSENYICAPTVLARREAWLAALPVPPHLAFHDWYFTLEIARRWAIYHRAVLVADYRVHGGNMHTARDYRARERSSIEWMLAYVFETPESDPARERAKQRMRRRVHGRQWLTLARKSFGDADAAAARGLYARAFAANPALVRDASALRQAVATLMPRRAYDAVKYALFPSRRPS